MKSSNPLLSAESDTVGMPANPATGAPATGLMALYPNVQFQIVSDPNWSPIGPGGPVLNNNDQVGYIQNPTTDYITPGNPRNLTGLNPTAVIMPWTNSRNQNIPPLFTAPLNPPTNPANILNMPND